MDKNEWFPTQIVLYNCETLYSGFDGRNQTGKC